MKLPERQSANYESPPTGNHLAVCYGVFALGTQETKWGEKFQVRIQWELPHEHMSDGRPHVIGKTYTYSSNEKSSFVQDLESWRGKKFTDEEFGNFEVFDVIGVGCFLNLVESGDYVNIDAIAPLPKGTEHPKFKSERIAFDFDNPNFDELRKLTDYWREKVEAAPEFDAVERQAVHAESEPRF
ncbi:MAG: hypothetical protein AAGG48_14695 [Planctomycetota bacterium]